MDQVPPPALLQHVPLGDVVVDLQPKLLGVGAAVGNSGLEWHVKLEVGVAIHIDQLVERLHDQEQPLGRLVLRNEHGEQADVIVEVISGDVRWVALHLEPESLLPVLVDDADVERASALEAFERGELDALGTLVAPENNHLLDHEAFGVLYEAIDVDLPLPLGLLRLLRVGAVFARVHLHDLEHFVLRLLGGLLGEHLHDRRFLVPGSPEANGEVRELITYEGGSCTTKQDG